MKAQSIRDPLPGEHVLSTFPTLMPEVEAGWQQRLHIFSGRTLTAPAMVTEQQNRAGRMSTMAQTHSPGIVTGLDIAQEPSTGSSPSEEVPPPQFLHISSGYGLTHQGEDVFLPAEVRLDIFSLPVYAPTTLLSGLSPTEVSESSGTQTAATLLPRRVGPALRELLENEISIPSAYIVVLQPVVSEHIGEFTPNDPCELDPDQYAYEDWQQIDGCRILLYAWPTEWIPLPPADSQWRNRIAHVIFEAGRNQDVQHPLPWEEIGVPIGLICFDSTWDIEFVDHAAVARSASQHHRLPTLIPHAGDSVLWTARVQQFAEQIAETHTASLQPEDLVTQFRYLPPVGLLPKNTIDARTEGNRFFPTTYYIDVLPIPEEQLDAVLSRSASLAPFDLSSADRVQIFVPVPQIWYDPHLLMVDTVDTEFQETLDRFIGDRAEWLQRRGVIRPIASAISQAITGEPISYPFPDPEALEEKESIGSKALNPPENPYGTTGTGDQMIVTALEELRQTLEPQPLQPEELEQLPILGVERFIHFLNKKVQRADDLVDLGFLRVQTDIYRIRQLMLGAEAATRLATSPALASIAQAETAVGTHEQLATFYTTLKASPISSKSFDRFLGPDDGPSAVDLSGASPEAPQTSKAALSQPTHISLGVQPSVTEHLVVEKELQTTKTLIEDAGKSKLIGKEKTPSKVTPIDVVKQPPISGKPFIRTISIAERIEAPKAPEAKNFTTATKHDVVKELAGLDISLNGLMVPGISTGQFDEKTGQPIRTNSLPLDNFRNQTDLTQLLNDPDPQRDDEAAFFVSTVELADHTIATLRTVEGRIQAYRSAIQDCQKTLTNLRDLESQTNERLAIIHQEVAEARHDVAVGRTLLAEETARIQAINTRRDHIFNEHVTFLAFQRPRLTDVLISTPVRSVYPGLTESPVPACLAQSLDPPLEIEEMVEFFKEAPIKWFPRLLALLNRLNTVPRLQKTLQRSKARAAHTLPRLRKFRMPKSNDRGVARTLQQVLYAQQEIISPYRSHLSQFDPTVLIGQSWTFTRDRTSELISLGDLIDGEGNRKGLAQEAATVLNTMTQVATCLYAGFNEIQPAVRLTWAEQLSQYDDPINLRNLGNLPRWHEVDTQHGRELQSIVDWLYQQVDIYQPEAVGLVNDLIRISILLATHSPVHEILAGRVPSPTTVQPGHRIELTAIDLSKIKIGMQALVYTGSQSQVAAKATIEDISDGKIAARVLETVNPTVRIDTNARVQFTNFSTLSFRL